MSYHYNCTDLNDINNKFINAVGFRKRGIKKSTTTKACNVMQSVGIEVVV